MKRPVKGYGILVILHNPKPKSFSQGPITFQRFISWFNSVITCVQDRCVQRTHVSVVCSNHNVSSTKLQPNTFSLFSTVRYLWCYLFRFANGTEFVVLTVIQKKKRSTIKCCVLLLPLSFVNWVNLCKEAFINQEAPTFCRSLRVTEYTCLKSRVCVPHVLFVSHSSLTGQETPLTGQSGQTPFWINKGKVTAEVCKWSLDAGGVGVGECGGMVVTVMDWRWTLSGQWKESFIHVTRGITRLAGEFKPSKESRKDKKEACSIQKRKL